MIKKKAGDGGESQLWDLIRQSTVNQGVDVKQI